MQERAFANPKIEFMWDTVVDELARRRERLEGAVVRNLKTGDVSTLPVTGMFVAIGHRPNTDLFAGVARHGRERLPGHGAGSTATNIEGVFACGDVQDHDYRQAITAAGSGCMAAIDAERWLAHGSETNTSSTLVRVVRPGMPSASVRLQLGTLRASLPRPMVTANSNSKDLR